VWLIHTQKESLAKSESVRRLSHPPISVHLKSKQGCEVLSQCKIVVERVNEPSKVCWFVRRNMLQRA
uniref:Uncharacterized protein n=1 Tax=Anopheles christyi TaxID=43041 RepID=A0A182KIE5_9DIPT